MSKISIKYLGDLGLRWLPQMHALFQTIINLNWSKIYQIGLGDLYAPPWCCIRKVAFVGASYDRLTIYEYAM